MQPGVAPEGDQEVRITSLTSVGKDGCDLGVPVKPAGRYRDDVYLRWAFAGKFRWLNCTCA